MDNDFELIKNLVEEHVWDNAIDQVHNQIDDRITWNVFEIVDILEMLVWDNVVSHIWNAVEIP